jgi:muramoyltetrapeptide carboxypeptidase
VTAIARPLPPPLRAGARVGVFALSGPPDAAALAVGIRRLEAAGFEVVRATNLGDRDAYLAGSDDARAAGVAGLLDAGVDALLAARGGYGALRALPLLPWRRLREWGGWLVGYSDVTAVHAAAAVHALPATAHGPMTTTLARHAPSAERLLALLGGRAPQRLFRVPPARVVRPGVVRGVAAGGNLSVLAALAGTPFEPDLDGAVLFVEEVGEPGYRLDRLLTQLRLSSRLDSVKALIAGRLSRCGRGEPGWRERWRRLLDEAAPPGAVVIEGMPFGHGAANLSFPLGVEVSVDTGRGEISWEGA